MSRTFQDLTLSIEDAEGRPRSLKPDFALLVTLSAEPSKNYVSITAHYADGTPITDVEVVWSSNCEEVASLDHATGGSPSRRLTLKAPGTATIQTTIRWGERDQQSASLTVVVAPGVLMFGPDGRYYHLDASVWRAHPLDDSKVPAPVTEMIRRGSVLFTSAYLLEQPVEPIAPAATCYVINLASMSNYLVAGVASAGSAVAAKQAHRPHGLDRRPAGSQPKSGASKAMRVQRMRRPVTNR